MFETVVLETIFGPLLTNLRKGLLFVIFSARNFRAGNGCATGFLALSEGDPPFFVLEGIWVSFTGGGRSADSILWARGFFWI